MNVLIQFLCFSFNLFFGLINYSFYLLLCFCNSFFNLRSRFVSDFFDLFCFFSYNFFYLCSFSANRFFSSSRRFGYGLFSFSYFCFLQSLLLMKYSQLCLFETWLSLMLFPRIVYFLANITIRGIRQFQQPDCQTIC